MTGASTLKQLFYMLGQAENLKRSSLTESLGKVMLEYETGKKYNFLI